MDKLFEKFGKGIKLPFKFAEAGSVGIVEQEAGLEKIKQSVAIILGTHLGERLFNVEFGSRLDEIPFELNDAPTRDLLFLYTAEAIQRWEKRVILGDIKFITDEENYVLGIIIELKLGDLTTSLVFPFSKTGVSYEELIKLGKIYDVMISGGNL